MATANHLLHTTQGYFTPDVLQKMSGILGQPVEKIQTALKAILPTFLMGVASKGTSTNGVQTLVEIIHTKHFDTQAISEKISSDSYLKDGSDAVEGVFEHNLHSVTETLSATTGLNSPLVERIMDLIAPVALRAFGLKVDTEHMNAGEISSFLDQEKSSLANFLPTSLVTLFGGASQRLNSVVNSLKGAPPVGKKLEPMYGLQRRPWGLILLLFILIISLFLWLSTNRVIQNSSQETIAPPATTTIPETGLTEAATALTDIEAFLNRGDQSALPKRFAFQGLLFETGTANLDLDAQNEIEQIAVAMGNYPETKALIEGFTDNTGDRQSNLNLSLARAQAVRNAIISRGISGSRLEAIGRGPDSPIATNDTEKGRARNRRIEFVITNF